jgi:hypothetical protein
MALPASQGRPARQTMTALWVSERALPVCICGNGGRISSGSEEIFQRHGRTSLSAVHCLQEARFGYLPLAPNAARYQCRGLLGEVNQWNHLIATITEAPQLEW